MEPRCRECGHSLSEQDDGGWLHATQADCEQPVPSARWMAQSIAADSRRRETELIEGPPLVLEEVRWLIADVLLSLTVLSGLVADLLPDAPEFVPEEPALAGEEKDDSQ